jgi:hypothetical protein
MKTTLDCIPCFIRQTLEAARFVSEEKSLHERLVREILELAARMDFSQSPPAFAQKIHRRLREIIEVDDPYDRIKDSFNKLAMETLPRMREEINSSPDPFEASIRIAIAGNVIDLGVTGTLTREDVSEAMLKASSVPLKGDVNKFRAAVESAEKILYLADNSGEIVFDKLLLEQLRHKLVTLAVRGAPIINDATKKDIKTIGFDKSLAAVIDNGSDAPGTILNTCSEEFQEHFRNADLIISKGQGNYETLSDRKENIFFLLKVKCPVIASHTGFPVGTHLLLGNQVAGNELCQDSMQQDNLISIQ